MLEKQLREAFDRAHKKDPIIKKLINKFDEAIKEICYEESDD